MMKHLTWSLLGIAELDPLDSVDSASVTLVHFLYGAFLIMGVILLVNMMIALLSNTYQRVEVISRHTCSCILFSYVVSLVEACVAKRLTPRSLDLEVQGSSLARRVVSLAKELCSTLSLFTQVYKWVPATYCRG